MDEHFFLILDRLRMTLDEKKEEWGRSYKELLHADRWRKRLMGGPSKKTQIALRELMVSRMTVAYDLAAAFFYLHDHK